MLFWIFTENSLARRIKLFLEKLSEQGVPLTELTVQISVAKTGRPTPYYTEAKYEYHYENAQILLDNIRNSTKASLASLKSKSSDQSDEGYTTDESQNSDKSSH